MLTKIQKIFSLSTVNGQPNFQELLPVNGFDFPKESWLSKRLEVVRKQQYEGRDGNNQ